MVIGEVCDLFQSSIKIQFLVSKAMIMMITRHFWTGFNVKSVMWLDEI